MVAYLAISCLILSDCEAGSPNSLLSAFFLAISASVVVPPADM